jgi:hypothetical protein
MKRNFTIALIISLSALFTLVFTGQTLYKGGVDNPVEEVASNKIATTSPIESTEAVGDEVFVVSPIETEPVVPIAPERAEPVCVVIDDVKGGVSQLGWFAVNDGVMGGLSQGSVSLASETLVHTGILNTNGGGFSYAGARLPADILVGYSRLQVRLNTFGRQYAVNFGDARNRRVSHQERIPLGPADAWQEVFIEFDQTIPTIFSRRVNSAPFAASATEELNFILADGVNGPFRMELDWIKACL